MDSFKDKPIKLKDFNGKSFSMHGFEVENVLWLLLDEVLQALSLTNADLKPLKDEEPKDFSELDDGRALISESGFYYLVLCASSTPAAQELANWVFDEVLPSIFTKGYYSIKAVKPLPLGTGI